MIMKLSTFLGFITLLKTVGCSDVVLSADQQFVMENTGLTFTCSALNDVHFVEFYEYQKNVARVGYLENKCVSILNELVSSCTCFNITTYTCTTNPLNRTNNNDIWSCTSTSHSGLGTKSKNDVYINVRVPITRVCISPQHNNSITLNEGDELQLTCEAPDGIPAANISWYLDNQTDSLFADDLILNASKREVIEHVDRTENVKSTLTHTVSRDENGMDVYCNASNEEYIRVSSKMIQLNVQYLPEQLVYINGHLIYDTFYMIMNSGTEQSLQCSVHGGNPLAKISWSCYNGMQTDMNTPSSAVSNVSWFARGFNDSTCTCHDTHVLGWSVLKAVSVHVLFEPSVVICKVGYSKLYRGILNATLFSNVELNCSSNGNPKPNNYTWIWPSRNTSAGQLLSFKYVQRSFQGKYTLLVENTLKPSMGLTLKGYANTTFDMHVQYAPGTPTFRFVTKNTIITKNSISVIRNDVISIACIADGNPTPHYTWSTGHEGQIITKAFDSDTNLTCEASNTLYPTGYDSTKAAVNSMIQVNVLYPPDILALGIHSTCMKNSTLKQNVIRVLEHDQISMECFTVGNPEPNCQWTNHSQSCSLVISNATKGDVGTYVCHASNTMNTTYGRMVVGRNLSSFHLDILYPPKIAIHHSSVEVLEGVNFSLICDAEPGNPNVTTFYWTSTQLSGRNTSGQYLIIYNISRTDEGIFTCLAQNIMQPTGCTDIKGNDMKTVAIDVQYKASIIAFTAMNTVNAIVHHGDEVAFTCVVDSDPPAVISILSTNGSILKKIHGNNRFNYIKNISCLEDIGQFTCVSANKHNINKDKRNVTVDVKCSPLYRPNFFQKTTFKTKPGKKIEILFSIFSNPPPAQFTWTNISNNMQLPIDTTTSDRVIINSTDDMSSALIIASVEPWDSGIYSVRVQNEIGSKTETFLIIVDINTEPSDGSSTSASSDNDTGRVVGGTVGAVCTVVIAAVLLATFFYRKRQSRCDNDRLRDESTLKEETRYEDIAMGPSRTPTEYSELDFQTETKRKQTPLKESNVYENLKLTTTRSSTFT